MLPKFILIKGFVFLESTTRHFMPVGDISRKSVALSIFSKSFLAKPTFSRTRGRWCSFPRPSLWPICFLGHCEKLFCYHRHCLPSQGRPNSISLWFRLMLRQFVRINIFLVSLSSVTFSIILPPWLFSANSWNSGSPGYGRKGEAGCHLQSPSVPQISFQWKCSPSCTFDSLVGGWGYVS